MNNQLSKKGWQFVLITCLLSTIPYYFIIAEGTPETSWTLVLMWAPAIAGVIMRLYHKEGLFSGLSWHPFKNVKWFFIAAFAPLFIELLTITLTVGTGAAALKPEFIKMEDGMVSIRGIAMLLGAAAQPWYIFIPNYLMSYLVGALFYSLLFTFGEEYGWRGYLQKQWASNNKLSAFLVIGLIWGWWHLPGILLGHNYPEYPLLGGLLLMPIVTFAFSVVFGVAFNKQYAIWIPVLLHGAVNISAEVSNVAINEDTLNRPANDTIWMGLWCLFGVILWKRYKNKQNT